MASQKGNFTRFLGRKWEVQSVSQQKHVFELRIGGEIHKNIWRKKKAVEGKHSKQTSDEQENR